LATALVIAVAGGAMDTAIAEQAEQTSSEARKDAAPRTFVINEFRVEGAASLGAREVESALLPYVGPGRALEDVEKARAALEKLYSDRGFQSVVVTIPKQTVRNGVVTLAVTEGKVGQLRVRGARYFSPFEVRRHAPSVAEGTVPNFNDIVADIYALNQIPDRRVTPALRAGVEPGTVDVDLQVQDSFPLHGTLELNNRYSVNTTHLRLNGSIHYDNLFQLGHSLGFSFQIAPEHPPDAKVFAGNYLARFPGLPWLSLSLSGVIQESDVSTLGGAAVLGRGRIFGGRAIFALPGASGFFHSINTGIDYKLFLEDVALGTSKSSTPVHYWPLSVQYGASWLGSSAQMTLSVSASFNIRGLSSDERHFDDKRYNGSASFSLYRGEVSRTDELPLGMQSFLRVSGQYAPTPLVGPEQFTAGGLDTVRGYLEVEAVGDEGALGTLELRSPSLGRLLGPTVNDWRFHVFTEGGRVWIHDALPEQKVFATLWSAGGGTRFKLFEHLSGTLDVGVPLTTAGPTPKYHPRVQFRVWGEF